MIAQILKDLQQGKMIIVTDNLDRENEADLVLAAEFLTTANTNFMIKNGSGIVCLTLEEARVEKLGLNLMVAKNNNKSRQNTAFTCSIEAAQGISTGVSAQDRTHTILTAIHDTASSTDLVSPGHVFPLQARKGGVFERQGHKEGSIDLMKMAGLKPAAVICELMNPDGSMMRGKELKQFAEKHAIKIISIAEILQYRLQNESLIDDLTTTLIDLEDYGHFEFTVIQEKYSQLEHVLLFKKTENSSLPSLVRIHSACMTGDLFGSQHCDCKSQLHYSLRKIATEGGVLIYLNQEGRGIGLFNKIKAYALQRQGLDTVEANTFLNLAIDARQYYIASHILKKLNINSIRLLTNNPIKLNEMLALGIHTVQEHLPVFSTEANQKYLQTKKNKLNHSFL